MGAADSHFPGAQHIQDCAGLLVRQPLCPCAADLEDNPQQAISGVTDGDGAAEQQTLAAFYVDKLPRAGRLRHVSRLQENGKNIRC